MDPSRQVFEARLEELTVVRSEMASAISNQHLALTFGSGALLAAFGAGFLSWDEPICPAIFFAIVPLSWWILTMWLGEVVRMLRAVEFCGDQERIINDSIRAQSPAQPDAVRWERWRRDPSQRRNTTTSTYISVAILLLSTNAAAMACGTVTAAQHHWAAWIVPVIWVVTLAAGLPFVGWVIVTFQTWGEADVGMPSPWPVRALKQLPLARKRA